MTLISGKLDKESNGYRKMDGKDIYVFKVRGNMSASTIKITLS
jgi:hypothetical protein